MKTLSLIFALAFLIIAPSVAGSPDGRLPGVGTFAYNGLPAVKITRQQIAALAFEGRNALRQ